MNRLYNISLWRNSIIFEYFNCIFPLQTSTTINPKNLKFKKVDIFSSNLGAASRMCKWAGVPLLGQVPLDPAIATATERGCSLFSDEVGGRNQNIRNLSLGISPASFEAMKTILDNVICAISEVQSDVFKTGQL